MNGANVAVRIVAGLAMVLCAGAAFAASDYDEFKVKREASSSSHRRPKWCGRATALRCASRRRASAM